MFKCLSMLFLHTPKHIPRKFSVVMNKRSSLSAASNSQYYKYTIHLVSTRQELFVFF